MVFQYILGNLLAQNERAVGALFLDGTGETVDLACSDFSPYEMRVIGAYLGIYLRHVQRTLAASRLGEPTMMLIEKRSLHIHVIPLPDGYFLALVQRPPALVGRVRRSLEEAAELLKRELFPE